MENLEESKLFHQLFNIIVKVIDFLYLKKELYFLYALKRNILTLKAKVIFVGEKKNWVVYWIGKYLTDNLKKMGLVNAEVASPLLSNHKIIHWGAINYLMKIGLHYLKKSNINILNWYHVVENDKRLKYIPYLNEHLDLLVTASPITKQNLINSGFNENKIEIIPFGIDLSIFKRYDKQKREFLKKKFNIPQDKLIIGSFQKDGVGWKDGLEPKFVKGPDIFCEVVKRLNNELNIHVFLTGPARGYVKKKLEESQISFTHIVLNNFLDMVQCYNVLDLYIVASRIEGGPQALLEAMSTGIPIVTTNVGMAPYLIKNGINGFITEVDDIEEIKKYSELILKDNNLREELILNGLKTIKEYSWENITKQYYHKVYKRYL